MSTVADRNRGLATKPTFCMAAIVDTTFCSKIARGPSHNGVGLRARDSVRRVTRTWTDSAMTDVCLGESKGDIAAHIQNGDWCDLGTALNTTASDHWLQWGLRNSDRFRAEKLFCVDSGSEMVTPFCKKCTVQQPERRGISESTGESDQDVI